MIHTLSKRYLSRQLAVASRLFSLLSLALALPAAAQGTAFTYQGSLTDGRAPATGSYDFGFSLYAQPSGGTPLTAAQWQYVVSVTGGAFTVTLDFGATVFNGADRWLEIAVRTNGGALVTTLSPRQKITATPYALKAREATTVPAGSITGAMLADGAVTAPKLQQGAALQNLLASGSAPVAPGGIVMSDDPASAALTNQGYARVPNAEMSLVAEEWKQLNPPATQSEFLPAHQGEIAVSAGAELLVFGFNVNNFGDRVVQVSRYNPATREWSKGAQYVTSMGVGPTAVWTGSQVLLWGGEDVYYTGSGFDASTTYNYPSQVYIYTPATDQWSIQAGAGAVPQGRKSHSAVWTGSRMIIWGGEAKQRVYYGPFSDLVDFDYNTGAAFDPVTGVWAAVTTTGAPSPRRGHTCVWIGSRMLVQGGTQANRETEWTSLQGGRSISATNVFNHTFSYNPANDTWAQVRSDSTSPRGAFGQAVWTGREMLICGSVSVATLQVPDGWGGWYWENRWVPTRGVSSYDPTNDWWTYRGVADPSGPHINGRANGSLVWTGSEALLWGGTGYAETTWEAYARNDGQAYNPTTSTWRTLPAAPSLQGGDSPPAAWLNGQMILKDPLTGVRAAYAPGSNAWSVLRNYFGPEPLRQDAPSAVWTGKEFIIWGGPVNGVVSNRGRRYNPATRAWSEMSTVNAPAARMRHSAVWTGSRMLVWGGDAGGDARYPAVVFSSGGAYDPESNTWTALPNAPVDPLYQDAFRRTGHKAVWTAYGMVVVGGSDGYNNQDQEFPRTIARLSPNLSTWTLSPASATYLLARWGHALATDGQRRVFLYGGQSQTDQDPILYGGVMIDPYNLNAWQVDGADEPEPRRNPSMVWASTDFIVWGGTDTSGAAAGGGGKFHLAGDGYWMQPGADGPVLTTTHDGHTAVWTGNEMLLWGGSSSGAGSRYNPRNDAWASIPGGPAMRTGAVSAWTGTNMLIYLPALASPGSIPELWSYRPPSKVYFYLKQ